MLGTFIAHYEITAKLGQGGMGEVYRATDTKLDREVAIKVLPQAVAQDKERLARFEREAKVLAQLNHPNIAAVHGFDQHEGIWFLVMECVDAEDLSSKLKNGPLPVDEALEIGKQITEALEAAHEKDIIHRDLKPANIKVDADGKVKVLDFGLAKALSEESNLISVSTDEDSPTITADYTKPGTILGTAAYMSPEQARGKHVDKRSDIWAFGCVLYECLTGKKAFQGEDVTETLASIIKGECNWALVPVGTPPIVQILLRKCLIKDKKRRLQHIDDAKVDLEQATDDSTTTFIRVSNEALSGKAKQGVRLPLVAGLVLIGVTITSIGTWFLKPAPPAPPAPPAVYADAILPGASLSFFAISPDGQNLAIDNTFGFGELMTLRHLDRGSFSEINKTGDYWQTFFSPDSESVGYMNTLGEIWRVALDGSAPVLVAKHNGTIYTAGASWSESGDIVFAETMASELKKVASIGGEPEVLTQLRDGETAHQWPQCLPGGTHVLFMAKGKNSHQQVAIADLTTGEHQILPLEDDCSYPRYSESGHILYLNNFTLFAVPFDLKSLTITGDKKDILHDVGIVVGNWVFYDLSKNGTLVYKADNDSQQSSTTFKWLSGDGEEEIIHQEDGSIRGINLSANEKYLAYGLAKSGGEKSDIWIFDLERKIRTRFTDHEANDEIPVFSPDGEFVYFISHRRDNAPGLWRKRTGSHEMEAEFIAEHEGKPITPWRISVDGRHMTYLTFSSDYDIWTVSLDSANPEKRLLKGSSYGEIWHSLSPDEKWLTYCSNRTGRFEIYLAPFDEPERQIIPVTSEGGKFVKWHPNGTQLYFQNLNGSGVPSIWGVDVKVIGDEIETGVPSVILQLPRNTTNWRVGASGERILITVGGKNEEGVDAEHQVVRVISNFFTELNEKAPPFKHGQK